MDLKEKKKSVEDEKLFVFWIPYDEIILGK